MKGSALAVISDIHGCSIALNKAIKIAMERQAGWICILGDVLYHGPRNRLTHGYDPSSTADTLNRLRNKIIAVRGNCDAEVDQMMLTFPVTADYNQLIWEDRKVFMTHGHLFDPATLPLASGDIYLQGHTHVSVLKQTSSGSYFFNPGSVALPKDRSFGTMGILSNGKIELVNIETGDTVEELILPEVAS